MQGNNFCLVAAVTAGMGYPPQSSPNHHVSTGTDARSWVHIPVNQNVPIALQMVSGPQCSSMNEESVLLLVFWRWLCPSFVQMNVQSKGCSAHNGFGMPAAKPSQPTSHSIQDLQQLLQIRTVEIPVTAIQLHQVAGFLIQQSRQSIFPML